MESWKSTITHLNCRCGFCGDKFEQWSARNEHLANHFCSGALMKDWEGCRGLDPAVAMLVRNAMPPYLIGTESKALIPFTAEKASTPAAAVGSVECEEAVSQSLRPVPTSFEILVAELSRYVNDQKRLCQVPTDEMLQRQARLIVYGDEDPWNQTAADSRQWLELFKMGHGIGGESQTSNACSGTLEPSSLEDDTAFQLPWYWQSPECLAEWKQSKAGFAAALGCDGRLDQTYIVSCDPASNDEMVYQNFATLDKNSALNLSEPITSATHDNLATTAHEMFTSSDINWLSCLPNDSIRPILSLTGTRQLPGKINMPTSKNQSFCHIYGAVQKPYKTLLASSSAWSRNLWSKTTSNSEGKLKNYFAVVVPDEEKEDSREEDT